MKPPYTFFGAVKSSSQECRQRVMLLEVRPEFAQLESFDEMQKALKAITYDRDKINVGYYGGDVRSWQRYTLALPVEGRVVVDEVSTLVRFEPTYGLKPRTWYVLALLHGNHNFSDYLIEDWLLPFRTEDAVEDPAPLIPLPLLCCACEAAQSAMVYLPCGHVCCCLQCDAALAGAPCPKCRHVIAKRCAVFFN
jgi:hypothetical protein